MAAKSKLSRAGTMKATAKEAVTYLCSEKTGRKNYYFKQKTVDNLASMGIDVPDSDTSTSGAHSSATVTFAQGTKGESSKGKKPSMKRDSTMAKTVAEAKRLLDGDVAITERKTRSAKKAAPAKPALKRAGTMQNTAKEGESFLNRTKGKKGKGKKK